MMTKYAILGFLNRNPRTGYELKKILTNIQGMDWQEDVNEIYKTLVRMGKDGLIVCKQNNKPAGKVYSITDTGVSELKKWVASLPEPPAMKNQFLVQLTFADLLNESELDSLLEKYENDLKLQILMQKENLRRKGMDMDNDNSAGNLLNKAMEHITDIYENELAWIGKLKNESSRKIKRRD